MNLWLQFCNILVDRTQLSDSSGLTDVGSFWIRLELDHLNPLRRNLVKLGNKKPEININGLIQAWSGFIEGHLLFHVPEKKKDL